MDFSFIIIILIITYIGSSITKYLFCIANVKHKYKIDAGFIAIPFSTLLAHNYIKKDFLKINITKRKIVLIEALGFSSFLIFTIAIINLVMSNIIPFSESIIIIILNFYFIVFFLYFSIHDIINLTLPEKLIRQFFLSVLIISFFVGFYRFLIYRMEGKNVLQNINMGYLDNLVTGLILASVMYILVKFRTGFSKPDIDLVFILGLILGFTNSLVSILFLSLIGSIFSVIYCIRIKKFRGVRVPFAPLLLISYILALGFGQQFIELLQRL